MTKFDINALGAIIREYSTVDAKADKAAKTLETAKETRERVVIKFADTCRGFGWKNAKELRKGGAHHMELRSMCAACVLTKKELTAFNSDQAAFTLAKDGKTRIYSAKHKATNKVRNFVNRLIASVEPYIDGTKDANADKAERGANASKPKTLDVYLKDTLDAMQKRIETDKRKAEPTGKNHDALRKAVREASIAILAQLK